MTNYLIAQAISIAILVGFTLVLVLRTRAQFRKRIRDLETQGVPPGQSAEQRKLEIRSQISSLQQELQNLDDVQAPKGASALRQSQPPLR